MIDDEALDHASSAGNRIQRERLNTSPPQCLHGGG
jgi:hypothetical protein